VTPGATVKENLALATMARYRDRSIETWPGLEDRLTETDIPMIILAETLRRGMFGVANSE
jgi:hypothetical protein